LYSGSGIDNKIEQAMVRRISLVILVFLVLLHSALCCYDSYVNK